MQNTMRRKWPLGEKMKNLDLEGKEKGERKKGEHCLKNERKRLKM